jgi:hypothetical protein
MHRLPRTRNVARIAELTPGVSEPSFLWDFPDDVFAFRAQRCKYMAIHSQTTLQMHGNTQPNNVANAWQYTAMQRCKYMAIYSHSRITPIGTLSMPPIGIFTPWYAFHLHLHTSVHVTIFTHLAAFQPLVVCYLERWSTLLVYPLIANHYLPLPSYIVLTPVVEANFGFPI